MDQLKVVRFFLFVLLICSCSEVLGGESSGSRSRSGSNNDRVYSLNFTLTSNCSKTFVAHLNISVNDLLTKLESNLSHSIKFTVSKSNKVTFRWRTMKLQANTVCCWSVLNSKLQTNTNSSMKNTQEVDICYKRKSVLYNGKVWACTSSAESNLLQFESNEYHLHKGGFHKKTPVYKICTNATTLMTTSSLFPMSISMTVTATPASFSSLSIIASSVSVSSEILNASLIFGSPVSTTVVLSIPSATEHISPTIIPVSSDFAPSSSSETFISSSVISVATIKYIKSSSLFEPSTSNVCDEVDGWNQTEVGKNATREKTCFKGTANETRLCGTNGKWDTPYCLVTQQFRNTLNQILDSPEQGLDTLSELVNQRERDVSLLQFAYLLDTVLETVLLVGNVSSMEIFTENFLQLSDDLIMTAIKEATDKEEIIEEDRILGSKLLLILDSFALNFVEPSERVNMIDPPTTILKVMELNMQLISDNKIVGISASSNQIVLPLQIVNGADEEQPVRIASFLYQNLSRLLVPQNADSSIISAVISSAVNCQACPLDNLTENVTIQFQVTGVKLADSISCVFFNFSNQDDLPTGDWSSSGCTITSVDGDIVTCSCNHLTHFAILLSPGIEMSMINPIHHKVLNIIGLVLVPVSLVCMVLVILTYTCIRSLWSIRNYIHIMLCASLFMAQLVFIIGIDKIKNEGACSAVAVLLQYLFLVTFMWMLMEGVVLYVTLVKVFIHNHKYYIIGFTLASYVIPAVYMAIVIPIGYHVHVGNISGHTHYLYYDDEILTACWLNYTSGFLWSFIVPVAIVILVNIGFFIMAIVIMRKHAKKQEKRGKSMNVKHWIKASISLTLVMGIAWLVGVLSFREELLFISYIITVFIAGQGILIFIIFVPLSKQVREAYLKVWIRQKSKSTLLSNISGFIPTSSLLVSNKSETTLNTSSVTKGNGYVGGIALGTFDNKPEKTVSSDTLRKRDIYGNLTRNLSSSIDSAHVSLTKANENAYEIDSNHFENGICPANGHAMNSSMILANPKAHEDLDIKNEYETVCENEYSTAVTLLEGDKHEEKQEV